MLYENVNKTIYESILINKHSLSFYLKSYFIYFYLINEKYSIITSFNKSINQSRHRLTSVRIAGDRGGQLPLRAGDP